MEGTLLSPNEWTVQIKCIPLKSRFVEGEIKRMYVPKTFPSCFENSNKSPMSIQRI